MPPAGSLSRIVGPSGAAFDEHDFWPLAALLDQLRGQLAMLVVDERIVEHERAIGDDDHLAVVPIVVIVASRGMTSGVVARRRAALEFVGSIGSRRRHVALVGNRQPAFEMNVGLLGVDALGPRAVRACRLSRGLPSRRAVNQRAYSLAGILRAGRFPGGAGLGLAAQGFVGLGRRRLRERSAPSSRRPRRSRGPHRRPFGSTPSCSHSSRYSRCSLSGGSKSSGTQTITSNLFSRGEKRLIVVTRWPRWRNSSASTAVPLTLRAGFAAAAPAIGGRQLLVAPHGQEQRRRQSAARRRRRRRSAAPGRRPACLSPRRRAGVSLAAVLMRRRAPRAASSA